MAATNFKESALNKKAFEQAMKALVCKYISAEQSEKLDSLNDEIGRLIYLIINNPEKY